jgi:hypothetical protein
MYKTCTFSLVKVCNLMSISPSTGDRIDKMEGAVSSIFVNIL